AGRVALLADASVMTNASLDAHDAAPLVVDLARRYGGNPWIDEWLHGFRTHDSLPLFLLSSPALPVFCGFALLAALRASYGASVPPPPPQPGLVPPSLDASIDALASAYAATADYTGLHERYRQYAAGRLRHHLGLPPDAEFEALAAAMERRRRVPRDR